MASRAPGHRDAEIGRLIRRERKRAGLTLTTVEALSRLSITTIGDSERGHRKILATEIIDLSETIGVDPAVLLGTNPISVAGANVVLADTTAKLAEEVMRLQTENGALRDELDRCREELSDAYRNA